ncbi:MAG TPA: hypothetical protein VL990_14075 [Acidobacteriaceae bacterium]|nr:hypothetical protein [Acidobacteriaceae bacterium]
MHEDDTIDLSRLLHPSQIADSCLLALACFHGGRLATFDRRLIADAVRSGKKSIELIG